MYIEYITPQRVANPNYTKYDPKGGDYRPTWLIRTSDWKKVPGHEATDGYHTLSYCWEQSGEKVLKFDGEYDLKDDGRHRIVEVRSGLWRFTNQWQQEVLTSHEVTYDQLVQRVCQDFDIEYLWYDKICIDQSNKAEKQREIKQMHLIYSNARYTVALVPEINIDDPEDFDRSKWMYSYTEAKAKALYQMEESLWFQRSWTLEEVMMSTQILIVGRNTHFWSLANFRQGAERKESDLLTITMLGFKERVTKSANQVLVYAHRRTSTREHDKIFALANIFSGMVSIGMNYDSDLLATMSKFYQHLAIKDLSVMCFGSNLSPNGNPKFAMTMNYHNLASWTGVSGLHSMNPISDVTLDQNCGCTIDDKMRLHIKCRAYTIHPTKYSGYDVYLNEERGKKADEHYYKVISSMDDFDGDENEVLDWSQWCMNEATCCLSTHYHIRPDDHASFLSPILPLSLTEECDECTVLGIVFNSVIRISINGISAGYEHDYLSPVARKSTDGFSYRIIGLILLKHFQYNEPRNSPQEVMDNMFNNLCCETYDFCIE